MADNGGVTGSGGEGEREAHPFVSPALFVDITTITVDPAYVAAAARRTGGPSKPTSLLSVLTLVAAGAVCGVAAFQTRQRAPAAARVRASLVAEAERRTEATDRLAARQAELRRETALALREAVRTFASGRELTEEIDRLQLLVGTAAVSGPGIVVTVDDGPEADVEEDARVSDSDLQAIVNALLAAGAEAVSVDDRRVGALTAIREAGSAILVDYRAVSPPYVVRAIGDPDEMEPEFGDSPTARRFRTFTSAYGMRFGVERAERLDLPSTAAAGLRYAAASTTPTPAPRAPARAPTTTPAAPATASPVPRPS